MHDGKDPSRPPTIEDVARRANVSRQTISRVINGKSEISPATRERVEAVIKELGYRPSAVARSLALRRSLDIGLIVPDITQPFYPEIARGVEDGAEQSGYNVFLSNAANDPTRELRALERLRVQRIAGAIVCSTNLDEAQLRGAVEGSFPIVLVHHTFPGISGTVIWPGYDTGGFLATEHLIATGRRRIAYLGLTDENPADRAKLRGYHQALERAGLPFDPTLVFRASRDFHSGFRTMAEIVARRPDIDALFACNDIMALGALRYAATHQIAVPDDLAVIGFGGSVIAEFVTPSLSTIVVPLHTIGLTAMQELLALINGQGQAQRHVHTQPELVVRESSRRA